MPYLLPLLRSASCCDAVYPAIKKSVHFLNELSRLFARPGKYQTLQVARVSAGWGFFHRHQSNVRRIIIIFARFLRLRPQLLAKHFTLGYPIQYSRPPNFPSTLGRALGVSFAFQPQFIEYCARTPHCLAKRWCTTVSRESAASLKCKYCVFAIFTSSYLHIICILCLFCLVLLSSLCVCVCVRWRCFVGLWLCTCMRCILYYA